MREEFVADKTGGGGDCLNYCSSFFFKFISFLFSGALVMESTKARVMMRVVYTREFLLQCASSPYCQLSPREISNISTNMPEILRAVSAKIATALAFSRQLRHFSSLLDSWKVQL